jgi:putative DNA primase/helicase
MKQREPNADAIASFVRALFIYADDGSFISLRAFDQFKEAVPPPYIVGTKINGMGLESVIDAAVAGARFAANHSDALVFAPPICTFQHADKASEADLVNGVCVSVELDIGNTTKARERLEGLLGPATVVVASGGEWIDADTGEIFPKLHLHWRLSEATHEPADHAMLKHARRLACALVNADPTAKTSVHPLRWPGSWHLKATPKLANIVSINEAAEVHLREAAEALEVAAENAGLKNEGLSDAATSGTPQADIELIKRALGAIPNADEHWDEWTRIGMILYRATGASQDGLNAWCTWSEKSRKFVAGACEKRWEHFAKSPPTRVGAGTLFMLAKAAGWQHPRTGAESGPEPPKTAKKEITRRTIAVQKSKFNINAEEGEAALLAEDYPVFRRDRQLVRPVIGDVEASEGRTTTTVMLVTLERPVLRQMLNEVADWQRFDARSKAMVAAAPPGEVAELILARVGYWPFRPISGVIATPTIRPDGSLLTTPGYDAASGLWLNDLPSMPAIPDKPTRDDAARALKILNGLLDGFPFVDRTARAVALSGMITPVVRAAMSVAPMHVASAPAPGTGKSYLWDVASHIAIGRPCAVIAAARDEAETEKRLIAAVLRGQPMVSIDNLNGPIDGDFVCQMIERPLLELRPLGGSDIFTIKNRITSYATGNNIRGRGDVVRRLIHCRLDANMEHPERRQFSTKPHIQVQNDRGRYVAACLTIVRAYAVADRPGCLPSLPSFEGWSDSVRSSLVWLGCDDPACTIEIGHDDDDAHEDAAALFAMWPDVFAQYTAAELIQAAHEGDGAGGLLRPGLLEAIKPIAQDRRGNLEAARLGYWLRGHKDLVLGKRKLVRKGTSTRPTWAIESLGGL